MIREYYNRAILFSIVIFMGGLNIISEIWNPGTGAGIYRITIFVILLLSTPIYISFRFKNFGLLYRFIIFFFIVSMSYTFSNHSIASQYKYYLFLTNVFFVVFITSQFDFKILHENAFKYLYYLALVQICYLIFTYVSMDYSLYHFRWALITEKNVSIILLSRILGFGILYIFIRSINTTNLIISLFLLFAMYFLNEMGPILALIVSLPLVFIKNRRIPNIFIYLLFGVLFIIVGLYVKDLQISNLLNDPRFIIYKSHFHLFITNPIFGAGISGYYEQTGRIQSAHNIFLEVISEFGIVGLFSFSFMFIPQIKSAIRGLKKADPSYAIAFIYIVICVQFSGNISLNPFFWFFGVLVYRFYKPVPNVNNELTANAI